jgi:NAD(P)H-binding
MSLQGMYNDGYFVSSATKSLCESLPKGCRFIVMGSDGVANPDGSDPKRPLSERCVLFLLRWLVPPHADNEMAAKYLYDHRDKVDWSFVRPTNLIDADVSEYDLFDISEGSLFGSSVVSRASVADMMVRLVLEDNTWTKYKHAMPVIKGKDKPEDESANNSDVGKKSN